MAATLLQGELTEALQTFFKESPYDSLKEANIRADRLTIEINLDTNEQGKKPCCVLTIYLGASIQIVLDEVRLQRSKGCKRGNEYLEMIRYVLENFFTPTNELFTPYPSMRVFFQVKTDISELKGITDVKITSEKQKFTKLVYEGKVAKYTDGSEMDFHKMTLRDLIDARVLGNPLRIRKYADFWEYVVREDYPTIYDGSIRMRGFARIVSKEYIEEDDEEEDDDEEDDDEDDESEYDDQNELKTSLLRKYWYDHVLPKLMENWRSHATHVNNVWDADDILFYGFDLGMATLLSRDDYQTWYMKNLGLSLCNSHGYPHEDENELKKSVRRIQSEPFVNVVPQEARKYFSSARIRDMTTKETVLQAVTSMRSLKYMTFFDVLRTSFLNHQDNSNLYSLEPYFDNVCRVLIPVAPPA